MPFNFPIEQNHFGELFAQGISNALNAYYQRKGLRRQQQQDQEQRSLVELQHPGFHFLTGGQNPPPVALTPIPGASQASGPAVTTEPRYKYGNGYFIDTEEENNDIKRKMGLAAQSEFQKALLTAKGTAEGNPALTNYRKAQTEKLNYDLAHPKPERLPEPKIVQDEQGNMIAVDPTTLKQTPLGIKGYHAPASQFSFPTGTDAQGNPIVLRANTKTGAVERTDVGRPAGGQAGAREAAQLDVAKNQAAQADAQMRKFEDEMLSGRRTISATAAATAKIALTGGAVTSAAAEAALNKLDPDLAMYVRSAKAISVAERLITPRGGSNYLTQTEGMLSGAGPHANAAIVNQARQYRQALVGGLQGHGAPQKAGGPLQASYDAAYQHLKQQGKNDAEIKAVIGERP